MKPSPSAPPSLSHAVRLPRARLIAAVKRAQKGSQADRDLVVRATLAFVYSRALYFHRLEHLCTAEDLLSEGVAGLLRAIEGFDASLGFSFLTFCRYWVDRSIRAALLRLMTPFGGGHRVKQALFDGNVRAARLHHGHLSPEQIEEAIARSAQLSRKAVASMHLLEAAPASLDRSRVTRDGEISTLHDFVADPRALPDAEVEASRRQQAVRRVIGELELSARERAILRDRLMSDSPQTLAQLGARFQCSRERIRQVERGLVNRLRRRMAAAKDLA